MSKLKICFSFLIIGISSQLTSAQNPITNAKGVSDPHVRVFNDTIYLFSGHDTSPTDKLWDMRDWRVFKTTNLLDWNKVETISPKDNYMADNTGDCWAGDAATRNGKYYFYFSDQKRGVGVMSANAPEGPYKDALGKPLVAPLHDPTIFIESDKSKTPYIIYGDKSDAYYIAELNEDMISTAETPKEIIITGEAWEKAPKWMDKNYLFKYDDTYYLSWGRDYAISKNLYGPYESVGAVGSGHHLDQFAHGSFFWWKGQFYHVWCYYIKQGFKFRETIVTYCHMDENGKIVTDTEFLDKHFKNGVGQYQASWDKIEAEWYYEIKDGIKKTGTKENGFVLEGLKDAKWIRFTNVNFDEENTSFKASFNTVKGTGILEIREESLNGKLLGTVALNPGANQELSTPLQHNKGKKDIFLKFNGNDDFVATLDYFSFSK